MVSNPDIHAVMKPSEQDAGISGNRRPTERGWASSPVHPEASADGWVSERPVVSGTYQARLPLLV